MKTTMKFLGACHMTIVAILFLASSLTLLPCAAVEGESTTTVPVLDSTPPKRAPKSDLDKPVAELLVELESLYHERQTSEDKLTDLRSYQEHIDSAKSELEHTAESAPASIDAALHEFKSSFDDFEKDRTPDQFEKMKKTFDKVYNEVFDADRWRKLKEVPSPKTNVVNERKFNPRSAEEDPIVPEPQFVSLKKAVDAAAPNTFAGPLSKDVQNLDAEVLHELYKTNLNNVLHSLSALKDQVRRYAVQEIEPTATLTRSRLFELQQVLAQKAVGQQDTFTLVGYMMVLLFALFLLSICARLIAVRLHGDFAGIIEEKTLIEFGGMAFILLTIIILGNTEKLDRQALGPLLGTIAGYIFGKSVASASVGHIPPPPPPSSPPPPPG